VVRGNQLGNSIASNQGRDASCFHQHSAFPHKMIFFRTPIRALTMAVSFGNYPVFITLQPLF
jgi:hypothetical protein